MHVRVYVACAILCSYECDYLCRNYERAVTSISMGRKMCSFNVSVCMYVCMNVSVYGNSAHIHAFIRALFSF